MDWLETRGSIQADEPASRRCGCAMRAMIRRKEGKKREFVWRWEWLALLPLLLIWPGKHLVLWFEAHEMVLAGQITRWTFLVTIFAAGIYLSVRSVVRE